MVDPILNEATDSPQEKKEGKQTLIPITSPHVLYCSSVLLRISKEEAILSFVSGGAIIEEFAFSLPHLKRLQQALTKNIAIYEEKYSVKISTNKEDTEEIKQDSQPA